MFVFLAGWLAGWLLSVIHSSGKLLFSCSVVLLRPGYYYHHHHQHRHQHRHQHHHHHQHNYCCCCCADTLKTFKHPNTCSAPTTGDRERSAILIQAAWRGYQDRKLVSLLVARRKRRAAKRIGGGGNHELFDVAPTDFRTGQRRPSLGVRGGSYASLEGDPAYYRNNGTSAVSAYSEYSDESGGGGRAGPSSHAMSRRRGGGGSGMIGTSHESARRPASDGSDEDPPKSKVCAIQ